MIAVVTQILPFKKRRKSFFKEKKALSGTVPGKILLKPEGQKAIIKLIAFNPVQSFETEISNLDQLPELLKKDFRVFWINIQGLADQPLLNSLADLFKFHPLALADAVNINQRSKCEDYDAHLFLITEILYQDNSRRRESEQLSVFLTNNILVTLQDGPIDALENIRERIRSGRGQIRNFGTDYLLYSIVDYAVDLYYPVLDELSEEIEKIEEALFHHNSMESVIDIYEKKRDLLFLRRNIWNERESLSDLIRNDCGYISPEVKLSLRDSLDHIIQISHFLEMEHEMTASLINYFQSSLSHRLNESIKFLTIISTIFIPLTFVVGVYGMNFSPTGMPKDATNPLNMPELYSPYGYVGFWIVSILLTLGMFVYFKSKGWIGKDS